MSRHAGRRVQEDVNLRVKISLRISPQHMPGFSVVYYHTPRHDKMLYSSSHKTFEKQLPLCFIHCSIGGDLNNQTRMPVTGMPSRTRAPNARVGIEPLTQKAFAQFGTVIQNPTRNPSAWSSKPESVLANQGSATKYLDVSLFNNHYDQASSNKPAKPVMNMFTCSPRTLSPTSKNAERTFPVSILERHPYTAQTFIPMGLSASDTSTAYLVIVAPTLSGDDGKRSKLDSSPGMNSLPEGFRPKGTGLPDLSRLRAFLANGSMSVTYGPGTWHAPMVVMGKDKVDFVVVQYANGVTDEDCQEVELVAEHGEGIRVVIDEDGVELQGIGSKL